MKHFGRLLVYFVMFLGPYGLGMILLLVIHETSGEPSIVEVYFLRYFMPSISGGFLFFAFGDTLCLKLGLYKAFLSYQVGDHNNANIERRESTAWAQDYVYKRDVGSVERVVDHNSIIESHKSGSMNSALEESTDDIYNVLLN